MTTAHRLKPWHAVVRLKDELRSGELALAEFAADLHEVTLARGRRPVYEEPAQFFALTYPTHALRDLVRDVAARLAGRSDKAVRQLELTYGGGKTHTLITLHHLFRDPAALPDLPAVREFREHVGADLPAARTAALCFDKIDAERGIDGVRGPKGETRALRHPWSVMAFQLAGADGLRALHADGADDERETPPAEPLLAALLERPRRDGLATLVLVDEVLMYAREKAGLAPVWRERIVDFFQYLTQAVAKVDTAALVASLLATDPRKQQGELGKRLTSDLFDVFRRQREEGVQPVRKEDVPEVLRRRFFEPECLRDPEAFRPHVIGVVRELATLDETIARARPAAEERFLASFPFHPDLTDAFYSRWTQLEGFQRTRGILRARYRGSSTTRTRATPRRTRRRRCRSRGGSATGPARPDSGAGPGRRPPARRLARRPNQRQRDHAGAVAGAGSDAALGSRPRRHPGRRGEPLADGGRGRRLGRLRLRRSGAASAGAARRGPRSAASAAARRRAARNVRRAGPGRPGAPAAGGQRRSCAAVPGRRGARRRRRGRRPERHAGGGRRAARRGVRRPEGRVAALAVVCCRVSARVLPAGERRGSGRRSRSDAAGRR